LISIHALLAEGDILQADQVNGRLHFNPRPPRGGRQNPMALVIIPAISIHALLAEGDHIPP